MENIITELALSAVVIFGAIAAALYLLVKLKREKMKNETVKENANFQKIVKDIAEDVTTQVDFLDKAMNVLSVMIVVSIVIFIGMVVYVNI